jgi:AcrR family transcriptional regulator
LGVLIERKPLNQLRSGRHGLPRQAVVESQRTRIFAALIDVVAERGYRETRVTDVTDRAGVSVRTFYQYFTDKEDCFLATYDLVHDRFLKVTAAAFDESGEASWGERIRAALEALLRALADNPAETQFVIVEVLAAGAKALARREAALRRFAEFLDAGRAESTAQPPPATSMALVAGVNELLYSEVLHGAAVELPRLLPDLIYLITLPYLGPERAADERHQAREAAEAMARTESVDRRRR